MTGTFLARRDVGRDVRARISTAARAVLVGAVLVASTTVFAGSAGAAASPVRSVAHAGVVGVAAAPAASERLSDRSAPERSGHPEAVDASSQDRVFLRSLSASAVHDAGALCAGAVHDLGARAPPAEGSA